MIRLIIMRRNQSVLKITDEQRQELSRCAASRTLPAGDVFRARLILALADGGHPEAIADTQVLATWFRGTQVYAGGTH